MCFAHTKLINVFFVCRESKMLTLMMSTLVYAANTTKGIQKNFVFGSQRMVVLVLFLLAYIVWDLKAFLYSC